jgi:hypothetical protein
LILPSIGRQHTLTEERTPIVTGRDSVPVARSIGVAVSIAVAGSIGVVVFKAAHDDPVSFVEAAAIEAAATSTMVAIAPETSVFSRSPVYAGCSEGGQDK